jgi:hypothetical protein
MEDNNMAGTAYLYRMPAGIAGDISRKELSKVEPRAMDSDNPVKRYGEGVKISGSKVVPIEDGDVIATVMYGFGARPYPMQAESNEALEAGTPNPKHPLDILKSGYMTVICRKGTPAFGGTVYIRKTDGSESYPIGGVEAAADGTDCEAVTGCIFMGEADEDGNVEISYNI